MKRAVAIILFWLGIYLPAYPETQVAVSATPSAAAIGDHIAVRLIVRTAPNASKISVSLPEGEFQLVHTKELPAQESAGSKTFENLYVLAFFQTGDLPVGPFTVTIYAGGQEVETRKSQVLNIKIRSVLEASDTDIKALQDPLALPGNPLFLLRYLFLVGGVIVLIAVTLLLLRRRQRSQEMAEHPLPAELELAQRLRELQMQRLIEKGAIRLFFIQLVEILKNFLQRYYRFPAADCTTSETLQNLEKSEREAALRSAFDFILVNADLVKFAKYSPPARILTDTWQQTEHLVDGYCRRRQQEQENENQVSQ
jgi:hypothetical protein